MPLIDNVYQDPCSGDSGGPLAYKDPETNKFAILGTVHGGGYDCATSKVNSAKGIWNRVSAPKVRSWIDDVLKSDNAIFCN